MYIANIKEEMELEIYEEVSYGWHKKKYNKVGDAIVTKIYDKYHVQIEVIGKILENKKFDISSFDIIDDKIYENNNEIEKFIKEDNRKFRQKESDNKIANNILLLNGLGIEVETLKDDEGSFYDYYILNFKYNIKYKISGMYLDYGESEYGKESLENKINNILYFISLIDDKKVVIKSDKFYSKCLDCNNDIEVFNLNDGDMDIETRISKFVDSYNMYEKYSRCESCKINITKEEQHKKRTTMSEKMVNTKYKDYKEFIESNGIIIVDEDYSFKGDKITYRRVYCKCGNRIASMSEHDKTEKHIQKMMQYDITGCEKCEKERIDKFIKDNLLILEDNGVECKIKCSCGKLIKKVVSYNADYNLYNMMLDNIMGCKRCMEELQNLKEEKTVNIRIRKANKPLNNKLILNYIAKEGKKKIKQMIVRNRNSYVIKLAKGEFRKTHEKLFCECCGFDFNKFGLDYAEAHHKHAIADREYDEETKLEDLVMLCSNCHTLIHGLNLTVNELRKRIGVCDSV